jgi:hypothetical protein
MTYTRRCSQSGSPMPDRPWKAWEREVANRLGGTRTGPQGKDLPDSVDVPLIAPECKLYERFIFLDSDMEQARFNATNIPGDKIPVVFLKEKKRGGRKAVRMDYDGFLRLFDLATKGMSSE